MNHPISFDILKAIPKIELHHHLDCSMRFSTLTELAQSLGIDIPKNVTEQYKKFLITEPMRDLETVLQKFTVSRQVLSSTEILERLAFETIEDAFKENIRILELRYSLNYIAEGHPHLSFEQIHSAFVKGVNNALKTYPMAVGFLAIMQRNKPLDVAEEILEFVTSHRDSFVGLDLADVETNNPPEKFASVFKKATQQGIPFTIHAGESPTPEAAENVEKAIHLGAKRIGHGLQIINNKKILDLVIKERIPLELCPTSNFLTQAVTELDKHPLLKLFEAGVKTTINTDDPGIFNLTLTGEYNIAANILNMSLENIKNCNQYAFEASFISESIKTPFWKI